MEKKQRFTLTMREMIDQRSQFERAPESTETVQGLPLREKQAIIDEVLNRNCSCKRRIDCCAGDCRRDPLRGRDDDTTGSKELSSMR